MSRCDRVATLSVFLVLLAGTLCGCLEAATFTRTLTHTLAYTPGASVTVVTDNGAVSISQSDRSDIEIVAQVRAISDERAQETSVLAERSEDGTLSVRARWPNDKRLDTEGCSFDIRLPGAEGVDIRTSNGRIEATGLAGNAIVNTSNGGIDVHGHDGPVTARTSNGPITIHDVSGSIHAQTSNGKIDLRGATGEVKTTTSNGHIRIDLAASSPGPVQATTSNGAISLGIGPGFAGTLELRTSNGALRVDELPGASLVSSGKDRLTLRFGDADHASVLHTSNGAIELMSMSGQER